MSSLAAYAAAAAYAVVLASPAASPAATVAPAPPSAVTGTAVAVTFATATLDGSVDPHGAATAYYFEYGASTAYGLQTSSAAAGGGTATIAESASVSGLSPSTTYHFRLVAVNAAGTVDGADAKFTTPATPASTVSTSGATGVSPDAATVSATVDPRGVPSDYYFQYGKTASYGSDTAAASAGSGTAAVAVSAGLGGLAAGTTYHYRIVGESAGGVVTGTDRTFTTGKIPAPSVATGAAQAVTASSALLVGSIEAHGVATSYYFEYGTTTAYAVRTPVLPAGSGTTSISEQALVSGLQPATTYHFRLVAGNAAGAVSGADRTFTTARVPLSLAATLTPRTVAVDGAVSVTGSLSGTASAGRAVVLQATSFPYTQPFADVGSPEVVSATGAFSFETGALKRITRFRVVTVGAPAASSRVLSAGVAVRVSFAASATRTRRGLRVTVSGSIAPAVADVTVYLEKHLDGRWVRTTRLTFGVTSTSLRYVRTLDLAHGGHYRVVVRVTDGARLSAVSPSLYISRPRE